MKKTGIVLIAFALVAALSFGNADAARVRSAPPATKQVCLVLNHQMEGISPIELRLRFLEMAPVAGETYTVAGRTLTTRITNPSAKVQRVVSGAAATFNKVFEVSLTTTDIQDLRNTKKEEGLAISNIHLLLDPVTLEGTFEAVNVFYPPATEGGTPTSNSFSGEVTRVECFE